MNESTLVPREEMGDLDWLARNVHVWPAGDHQPWCYVYMAHGGVMKAAGNFLDAVAKPTMITIDQWLARRAELQNKPSWEDAPEWVGWLAQDKSGSWWFFRCHPKAMSEGWDSDSSAYHHSSWVDGEVLGDWRDTLEKRPEQAELEPFVSVEDAKITIMQSDGDVKHFGGIIGRSLPIKEDAATAKQHDPVNSPSHYASGGIECIDAIKASMSHEAFLGYLKGNVQKYMWRYEKKVNPSEDLKKARWYLDKLIEERK